MKYIHLFLLFAVLATSCKKDNNEPEEEFDGAYPGKVKSINNGHWEFFYTEDGKLAEYKYNYFGLMKTASVTWETHQVTCNDGIGFTYIRPFNSAGYAIPGNNDQNAGNNWTYDLSNQVIYLNGSNYYWSNGNIDSLKLGSLLTVFEYTNHLETRDMGANLIPIVPNFPEYNLNVKNLRSTAIQYDAAGDTSSIRLYTYTFNSSNKVASELINIVSNGDTSYYSLRNYEYYE